MFHKSDFDLNKSLPFHSPAVSLQRLGDSATEGQPSHPGPVKEKGELDMPFIFDAGKVVVQLLDQCNYRAQLYSISQNTSHIFVNILLPDTENKPRV